MKNQYTDFLQTLSVLTLVCSVGVIFVSMVQMGGDPEAAWGGLVNALLWLGCGITGLLLVKKPENSDYLPAVIFGAALLLARAVTLVRGIAAMVKLGQLQLRALVLNLGSALLPLLFILTVLMVREEYNRGKRRAARAARRDSERTE